MTISTLRASFDSGPATIFHLLIDDWLASL